MITLNTSRVREPDSLLLHRSQHVHANFGRHDQVDHLHLHQTWSPNGGCGPSSRFSSGLLGDIFQLPVALARLIVGTHFDDPPASLPRKVQQVSVSWGKATRSWGFEDSIQVRETNILMGNPPTKHRSVQLFDSPAFNSNINHLVGAFPENHKDSHLSTRLTHVFYTSLHICIYI